MTKKVDDKKPSFFTRLGATLKKVSLHKFSKNKDGKSAKDSADPNALDNAEASATKTEQGNGSNQTQLNENEQEKILEEMAALEANHFSDELELEPEHPLLALWDIHTQFGFNTPRPCLRLQNKPDKPEALTQDQVERELSRLGTIVNSSAVKRLKKAVPKKEDEPTPDLDAEVVFFLTSGQMSAWILILPPIGAGQNITLDMLKSALEKQKITYGVDTELLNNIPELSNRYFHLFLIAQGTPPERGKDGHVTELFPRVIKHEFTTDEYDRVDYTSLNFIRNVSKGETICQISQPTPGVPGYNVVGRELTAVDGKKASVPMGRNTELNEDGSELVASMTGHVEFSGRTFQVKPVLEIAGNVDYSTGNINFLGDVHVHGDVCSGFTVRAIGSITIEGVVEACSIEAGGDLVMVKGVLGNNQAIIRSHRSVYTKYLESASVCARGDLQAECIINCDIYCDGSVQVRAGKGIIKGGNINAAKEVSAITVGTISEIPTYINLGDLPCENFERNMLEAELKQLEEDLEKTDRLINSPVKLSTMSKLRMKIAVAKNKLAQLDKDDDELLEEENPKQPKARLVCSLAHPGTQITIKGVTKRLNLETHMCNAKLFNGEIILM